MKKFRKKVTQNLEESLLVSIDLGMNKHAVLLEALGGEVRQKYQIKNNRIGFEQLREDLARIKRGYGLKHIVLVCEPTARYGQPLLEYLDDQLGVVIYQVSTVHTSRYKEITDNSWNKTDSKDCETILDLLKLDRVLSHRLLSDELRQIRELIHFGEQLKKDRVVLLNRLHSLLSSYFPEFTSYFSTLNTATALYLLGHYPSPEALAKSRGLAERVWRVSRGHYDLDKLEALTRAAQTSIGVSKGRSIGAELIAYHAGGIQALNRQISKLDKRIEAFVQTQSSGRLLLSIKGIGPLTAAIILSELTQVDNFRYLSQVLKYAGLNLNGYSSGKYTGPKRISKVGRKLLRKALYNTVNSMIKKKGGIFRSLYEKHRAKGMPVRKAKMCLARKLLRTIFAMLRDGTSYDPQIQMKNAA